MAGPAVGYVRIFSKLPDCFPSGHATLHPHPQCGAPVPHVLLGSVFLHDLSPFNLSPWAAGDDVSLWLCFAAVRWTPVWVLQDPLARLPGSAPSTAQAPPTLRLLVCSAPTGRLEVKGMRS